MSTGFGPTDVTTGWGLSRFTVTLAMAAESAWLTAVMVTEGGLGRTFGAVYTPVPVIVPTLELPPETPFTCHSAVWSVELIILADKLSEAPARMLEPFGESVT